MAYRVALLAALWLAVLGAVGYRAYAFETAPGRTAPSPPSWPAESTLIPAHDRPTLVMFVHPECACTAASLSELASVLGELALPPRVLVVFMGDPTTSASWQTAGQLGALRVRDDGREARRFGARTSGHVEVFDARGALRFTGGLTGSRGHVGDNVGRRAVLDALRGRPGEVTHSVFGCALEALR